MKLQVGTLFVNPLSTGFLGVVQAIAENGNLIVAYRGSLNAPVAVEKSAAKNFVPLAQATVDEIMHSATPERIIENHLPELAIEIACSMAKLAQIKKDLDDVRTRMGLAIH